MQKIYSSALFIFLTTYSFAQVDLAGIYLPTDQVADVQTKAIGDSLFVAVDWFDSQLNLILKKGYWVGPKGTVTAIDFGFLQKVTLSAIEDAKDTVYYYYQDFALSKKKEPEIRVMRSTRDSKRVQQTRQAIPFEGILLGILNEDGIKAITFDIKTRKFKIIALKNGLSLSENEIQLDDLFVKFLDEPITLIDNKSLGTFADGVSPNKLYFTNNELVFIASNFDMETIVLRVDFKTGKRSTFKVPIVYEKNGTCYNDNLLYLLSASSNEYTLRIFDLPLKKEIYKKAYPRMDAFKGIPVYRRVNNGAKVYKDGNLYNLIHGNLALNLSLVVEDHLSKKLLTLGNYVKEKNMSSNGIVGGYANGIAGGYAESRLGGYANGIAGGYANGRMGGYEPDQSIYAYLAGDTTRARGFILKNEFKTDKPWRQIVDDFEIDEQKKEVNFKTKNYQFLESKKIAAVYHEKKQKSIRIIVF
jgi:hypothetical protein